jgi:hypothetical protein
VNYITSDSEKLSEAFDFLGMIIVVPIKFLIGIVIAYSLIGFYFVPVVIVAGLISAINYKHGKTYTE